MPLRRKKWSEEEERTLIDKYAVMLADGTLSKLKTREKRFKPIAAYVNMMHHERDPVAFPWQWTWKDVSTKVQNMRHQYLGVKQKIKKSVVAPDQGGASAGGDPAQEEYDWIEGLSRWSDFLRYKDVFGDVVSEADDSFSGDDRRGCTGMNDGIRSLSSLMDALGPSLDADLLRDGIRGIDGGSDLLGLALGSDYDGQDGDGENQLKEDGEAFEFENSEAVELGKKRKRLVKNGRSGKDSSMVEQRLWEFLVNQIAQLREREARLEGRRYERPKKEQFRGSEGKMRLEGREKGRGERDQNWERSSHERVRDWDTMEKESAERDRRRREEDMLKERECEEKMEKRREEWKKRMDNMLRQHRVEMEQLQARIMQDQQNVMNQLLGLLSQWTGHSTGLPDHTSAGNAYLSQMVQNLHHVNGIVPGESRIDGDNHDDQFIVDA